MLWLHINVTRPMKVQLAEILYFHHQRTQRCLQYVFRSRDKTDYIIANTVHNFCTKANSTDVLFHHSTTKRQIFFNYSWKKYNHFNLIVLILMRKQVIEIRKVTLVTSKFSCGMIETSVSTGLLVTRATKATRKSRNVFIFTVWILLLQW